MNYVAYVDGSYMEIPGLYPVYASAAILAPEGSTQWKTFAKVCNDKYIDSRNVAGEIFAILMVCEHLLKAGDCNGLTLYYDYNGIEAWATGSWQAKKELPKLYKQYLNMYVFPNFRIRFIHVKGHSGVEGNEIVDSMCRDAIAAYAKEHKGD